MDADKEITTQQSLCLSCGLCCDGTLFGKVPLKPSDILPPLEAAGIEIQSKETKKSFKQPCVAFQKNCCQVYADRPTNCRKYRCELLKNYESGNILWEEAVKKVNRAREIRKMCRTELSQNLPEGSLMSIAAILRIMPEHEEMIADPELLKKWGTTMLRLSALLDYLQTHFQSPRPAKDLQEEQENPADRKI